MADVTIYDLPNLSSPDKLDWLEGQKDQAGASGRISFQDLFTAMLPGILDQSQVGTALSITASGDVNMLFNSSIQGNLSVTGSINGEDITNKVNEAPIDGKQYGREDGAWTEIAASTGAVWGQITGTLSDQTDLQAALDAKAPTNNPTFTGQIFAPSGTAGAPGYGFSGKVGTGIFSGAASRVSITAASVEQLRVDTQFTTTINRLAVQDGSETAPGITFANDSGFDSGLFRPSENTLGVAVAGAEVGRVASNASLYWGTTSQPSGSTAGWEVTSTANVRSAIDITTSHSHYLFYNPNGIVGSITTSGSGTQYNQTSDPRLKTEFETADPAAVIQTIQDFVTQKAIGKYKFLADVESMGAAAPDRLGFNAHLAYDLSGGQMGAPGEGPRTAEIGSVYIDPTTGEEKEVTPWGVDQSLAVPHLVIAADYHENRIAALESRVTALETA